MLTAVVLAGEGDEERLARTLGALMPAVLDGFLREAVVVDGKGEPGVAQVADHAGCDLAPDLRSAAVAARSDWLLVLEAGARLEDGWGEAAREHLAKSRRPARFSAQGGLVARLFWRGGAFRHGLLVRRDEALAAGEGGWARLRAVRLKAGIGPRR